MKELAIDKKKDAAMKELEPFNATKEQIDAVVGRYYSFELDVILTVRQGEEGLEIVTDKNSDPLDVKFESEKKLTAGMVTVDIRWKDNEVDFIRLNYPRASNMKFEPMVS